jgi:phage terminase large subunit-like protein
MAALLIGILVTITVLGGVSAVAALVAMAKSPTR